MQVIKDEVVDDEFVEICKDFAEKVQTRTAIVFLCNTEMAQKHMTTMKPARIREPDTRDLIKAMAHRFKADGVITIISRLDIEGQTCMALTIETLLDRQDTYYPYDREGDTVTWKDPISSSSSAIFGDLLPTPAGMASA